MTKKHLYVVDLMKSFKVHDDNTLDLLAFHPIDHNTIIRTILILLNGSIYITLFWHYLTENGVATLPFKCFEFETANII